MRSVGVRLLKNHLSQYLQLVKQGETIFITDYHKIIAEIKQPSLKNTSTDKLSLYLEEEKKKGNIICATEMADSIDQILLKRKKRKEKKLTINWKKIYHESRED